MSRAILTALLLMNLTACPVLAADEERVATVEPLMHVLDLNLGQERTVELAGGRTVAVKVLDLQEERDSVRNAVRRARVTVDVNGRKVTLISATYHLPITVGDVQIDCPITKGCVQEDANPWSLNADVRLRLWPSGSPWIRPGTFAYPVNRRWFASYTLMANEIGDDERPDDTSIYYHWGLDLGGAEGMVSVLAATDGLVVSAGEQMLSPGEYPPMVKARYDVIYIRDARGWYYRYSHLDSIDPAVKVGARVKIGQQIGTLGKRGASGGWSHLHFDVATPQPSGRYGITDGYAMLWQVYQQRYKPKLLAVARPHQLAWTGKPATLDGTNSFSRNADGPKGLQYDWILSDGTTATGATVERTYDKPGTYSEILKITDDRGNVDYDFAVVQVLDRRHPDQQPPTVHAAYWPTFGIRPGDDVTFKVRSFRIGPDDGAEVWDFGDGTPTVEVQSDGNVDPLAKDGYAVTTHRYDRPGCYLVSVCRTNHRGEAGTARLKVLVEPDSAEDRPMPDTAMSIELDVAKQELHPDFCWFHPRVAAVPGAGRDGLPAVIMTIQKHLKVSDYYSGMWTMRTDDLGKTWIGPTEVPELAWVAEPSGVVVAVADVTPGWHADSGKLLAIGCSVRYSPQGQQLSDVKRPSQTAYAIHDPKTGTWSPWQILEMPSDTKFDFARNGCSQWLVKPDGTLLIPIYFAGSASQPASVTVVHCRFDGKTLTYVEHGTELSLNVVRGLCEPSLIFHQGRYYLTIRNDERGYITTSGDGLHFRTIEPWTFDDGNELGSYNTQQHWLSHGDALYLSYTRRGADNDHIFRHPAPLFLARVDTERLCVLRETEKVLIPERGAAMGNFGAAVINEHESWVTVAEYMAGNQPLPRGTDGSTFVSRVIWSKPQ